MFDVQQVFQKNGIKITRQREELIKLLQDLAQPMTAEDLFLLVKERYPEICLATIYRNLDLFVHKKLVRQLQLSGNKRKYELIGQEHYHYLICLGCQQTVRLKDCPIKLYAKQVIRETSYQIVEHSLSLYGYCPQCQAEVSRKE